jgi:L-asparagine transporter-like permease
LIKVTAILVFIAVGLALVTGIGPWPATGLHNLTGGRDGFLPTAGAACGWR